VRLPTEQEWERAARGTEGRVYPWGEKFDRNKVNCSEFWAGVDDLTDFDTWRKWYEGPSGQNASTTIVGQIGEGNTPNRISDLSGNVWEWTASTEGGAMVLRGGSWGNNRDLVQAARRSRLAPDGRSLNIGFRVARSP
jgi:formylglycine-generating enzyme required for sulfatase activity